MKGDDGEMETLASVGGGVFLFLSVELPLPQATSPRRRAAQSSARQRLFTKYLSRMLFFGGGRASRLCL